MKLRTVAMLPAIACLSFVACKKKTNDLKQINLQNDAVYPTYSNLQVGNYWIYQHYTVDSNGEATATNMYDSIYVERDTAFHGQKFYKLVKKDLAGTSILEIEFLRDSLHYIVTNNGEVRFSSQDFNTIFYSHYLINGAVGPIDSVGYIEKKMTEKDKDFTVPAGTFVTSNMQTTWYLHPAFAQYGPTIRRQNFRYAKGVGLITETLPFYSSIPTYDERRLVRYRRN